jgi:hypothetical protein
MSVPIREDFRLRANRQRVGVPALVAGGLLLAASIAGAFFSPRDFFHSYLIGYLFWLGLALGSLAYLMLQYLTGGAWGIVSRRTLEAATRTLPLLAVLFIPIAFGLGYLYDWARPELVRQDTTLQHRSAYMNPAFFLARAAIYLFTWMVLAHFLNRWSVGQARNPEAQRKRLARLSAPGLIIYGFTITFAAVDWALSLESRWYSTMWGFLFITAETLTALGFLIIVLAVLSRREPMLGVLKPDHFHDLGKMLLANLLLWAYCAFCQFLIVWSENLPDEISYYLPRTATSWGWLGLALILAQLLIPALLLINRRLKRHAYWLAGVVGIILVMRYMDLVWIVLPGYYKEGFRIQWMDVLTPLGIGGVWLWAFLRELPKYPLLPVNAPELEEALAHEVE